MLSLPTFYQTGNNTETYFTAVDEFIGNATERNTTKIIIDLQQNHGGLNMLALSTFKRFFYALDPYTGSRTRSHELTNILGNSYSTWWDGLERAPENDANQEYYWHFAGSEWVATTGSMKRLVKTSLHERSTMVRFWKTEISSLACSCTICLIRSLTPPLSKNMFRTDMGSPRLKKNPRLGHQRTCFW